jgi:hypothetical protein
MKVFGTLMFVLGMAIGGAILAADMQPMPASTTSKPATPACCGDACMKMGAECCKTDDKGEVTCSMGGSCCVTPSTAPASSMPAMGGMDMGK